ncbi:MAG: threonine--tRNA ligase [Candidatus Hadarchaeales archaeon]
MRLLLIHADFLEFKALQPTPMAEEVEEGKGEGRVEEVLVAFTAVEEEDGRNPEVVISKASEEILDLCKKLGVGRVAVYPYAHLSPSLSSPDIALRILKGLREELTEKGLEVLHVPFGWYKAFTLRCKGHPLSELSRTISPEPAPLSSEREEGGELRVLSPDGREERVDPERLEACKLLEGNPFLKQYLLAERGGRGEEPAHLHLMRRLELVDYEPASDVGHFRFYPKGELLKSLLEDYAAQLARSVGALFIQTPLLYRLEEKDIGAQAAKFLAKDYRIKLPGKTLLLRFAGDFGLFRMMKEAQLSYRQLPLRVFELSPSFRLEQSGECVGLKRLRSFTMPDLHCFCSDLPQALEEYKLLFRLFLEPVRRMGLPYALVFRVVEEFYLEHRDFILELVREEGRPALLELLPGRKHYWVMKHELQFLDPEGGNSQLSTVQLDLEDSERYGILYTDDQGKKKGCVILHSSMGSIERWIYALLENAERMRREGKPPSLPLWLSPTQVRLIPVGDRHLERCLGDAEFLEGKGVRADVDDRDWTVARKIREAEREWIPYIAVVGEREMESGKLSVRVRGSEVREYGVEELAEEIRKKCEGFPHRPLTLPKRLSLRPIFVGS